MESVLVICRRDVVVLVRSTEVGEPIWRDQNQGYWYDQTPRQAVDGVPEKKNDTPSQYEQEENLGNFSGCVAEETKRLQGLPDSARKTSIGLDAYCSM